MAVPAGLEPALSDVTDQCFSQLNYETKYTTPATKVKKFFYQFTKTGLGFSILKTGHRTESRTPVAGMKTQCLNHLTTRRYLEHFTSFRSIWQLFLTISTSIIISFPWLLDIFIAKILYSSIRFYPSSGAQRAKWKLIENLLFSFLFYYLMIQLRIQNS